VFYASILSSLLVALTIYFLSAKGGFSGGKLILIGIGMQSMLGALVSYLLLKASQYEVPGALRWLNGSLNGIQLEEISWLIFIIPLVGFITVLLGKQLKILELGDLSAISLGLRLKAVRISLIVCGVLLIAFATGVTGPIAFVSFLSGPISLRLVGNSSSNILPSALVGALLVLISDFMGQYAFGVRFPVGIVTGVIGAPYLLYLLIRMNRGGSI
ncbi:MAG TPA: iron ABC transporter, partial [Eubacteriaceae bacterium]|nr:iron ABC transporter [Eubacteriaceae bacterium]